MPTGDFDLINTSVTRRVCVRKHALTLAFTV